MKDIMVDEFQYTTSELLFRNKSILDLLTKFQDSNARINRSIIKSVTQCGCIRINGSKQDIPLDKEFDEIKENMNTHIDGNLCDNCVDIVERDIGRNLFYLASLCNTTDLNLYDIILKEQERIKMLGKYNLR